MNEIETLIIQLLEINRTTIKIIKDLNLRINLLEDSNNEILKILHDNDDKFLNEIVGKEYINGSGKHE